MRAREKIEEGHVRTRGKTLKDPGFYLAGFCALGFREGSIFMFVLFQKNTLGFQQEPMRKWTQASGT